MAYPDTLLSTKQTVPPSPPHWVPRSRLSRALDKGLHPSVRLTLISAPAGYGKTCLLSEWLRGRPESAAWITLDEGDNDPARFLSYFVAALQTWKDDIGRGLLDALQLPDPPNLEYLLTGLINQIADVDDDLILVLDDFHLITAVPIREALAFFVDHHPPQLHLVLATRADPPFALGRMRGKGQLCELREADLRFTRQETASLLKHLLEPDLLPEQVAGLVARTEGWAAGLQLAALSLRGHPDIEGFIRAFSGGHEYILDYLSLEVLSRLPEDLRVFLLSTSILNRLSGPLCEAVSGQPEAMAKLMQIRDANLFLMPLDERQEWYRYHRLFAESLRQRLTATQPERIPDLHQKASAWFWLNNMAEDAIHHALLAGDFDVAAQQIETIAEATLMRSEVGTLLRWIQSLPQETRDTRPLLLAYYAAAAMLSAQSPPDRSAQSVTIAGADNRVWAASEADAVQALRAILKGDVLTASDLSTKLLESLPEERLFLRSVAAWNLAISHVLTGEIPSSLESLEQVAEIAEQADNKMIAVIALCHSAEISIVGGRLADAGGVYERALEFAVDETGHDLPIAGMPLIGLAELHREKDDIKSAERYLQKGRGLIADWAAIGAIEGLLILARIEQSKANLTGAQDALDDARRMAAAYQATEWDDFLVATQQALLWMTQGNLARATIWGQELDRETIPAEQLGTHPDAPIANYHLLEPAWIALARLCILQSKLHDAQDLLDKLLRRARQLERWGSVLQINILQAMSYDSQSNPTASLESLHQALRLAEQGEYVRVFLDEGTWVADLLRQALNAGLRSQYVSRLLDSFEQEKTIAPRPRVLVDALSDREMQVLRLLSTHLSSGEIGEELNISSNTVRSHIKNIYGKLGAHSRSQAIERARELGFL